jgi:catechol 2,3-dioxygenase-like lactoylglutathione lyase family enzyme
MTTTRVISVSVSVRDQDEAIAFYTGVLGCELREAGVVLHDDEVLHLEGAPPMFSFLDPDGNGLVYLEDRPDRP